MKCGIQGSMFDSLEKLAAAIGALVLAGGTVTGLALWLFKLFGEKWLSSKFAKRLEAFKHDQQKEIEHLRFEISKLLDRTIKLHQREFEVLPRSMGASHEVLSRRKGGNLITSILSRH